MPGYELNTPKGMKAVVDRLAAYEETGLTPEEVAALNARHQESIAYHGFGAFSSDQRRGGSGAERTGGINCGI